MTTPAKPVTRSPMPAPDANPEDWINWCAAALEGHAAGIEHDPQTNSVKRLAFDLSSGLQSGAVITDVLERLLRLLSHRALLKRTEELRAFHGTLETGYCGRTLETALDSLAAQGWEAFSERVGSPAGGIVFTAHPTFALPEKLYGLIADYVSAETGTQRAAVAEAMARERHAPDPDISLFDEHRQAQKALAHAQDAVRYLNREILKCARLAFPDRWKEMHPRLITLASWVGYDIDGRKDIHWGQTIRLRLEEKALQLSRYAARLAALTDKCKGALPVVGVLRQAAESAGEEAQSFAGDLDDPGIAVRAANRLTEDDPRRLVSLKGVVQSLTEMIEHTADEKICEDLILLRADMETFGLGTGHIHLRVNASQVRAVIRHDLEVDPEAAGFGRLGLAKTAEEAAKAKAHAVNFATIFMEQMTVRRQLMLCAQFIKHVDADAPIRFLIAECEDPTTIMGMIYLARLYGVSGHLDISPLFETPTALERGGRFMEQLIGEEEYRDYVKERGRIAIQVGFSDSGRFMGQIPAQQAIERLHILLARAIAAQGDEELRNLRVIIFNTHGESMGRGAHPHSFFARLDHLLTPWARGKYAREGISLTAEESFQGGDGFLHFATPALALSTLTCFATHILVPPPADTGDPFYHDINFTWDLYRAQKAWQETLFDDEDYRVALGSFAPHLLNRTGSRKTRRQTGAAAGTAGPRALRAIPHNAILQQLAIPVNVCGGIGSCAEAELGRYIALAQSSDRVRMLLAMAARARASTSLPVLRAYAHLYDSSFWMARSIWAKSDAMRVNAALLSRALFDLPVATSLMRLGTRLSTDLALLDRILAALDGMPSSEERRAARAELHILHAVRIALMMQSFLLIADLPDFSKRHDVTRDDIISMVLQMQIDEAVALLDRIFPANVEAAEVLQGITEPADVAEGGNGYPRIQAGIVRPLERLHGLIREAGVGISHAFGAYG